MSGTQPTGESKPPPVLTAVLVLHGERFSVAALGPDEVIVRSPRKLAPGRGTIRLTLDDHVTTYHVELPNGLDPRHSEQTYHVLDARRFEPRP